MLIIYASCFVTSIVHLVLSGTKCVVCCGIIITFEHVETQLLPMF